MTDLPPYKTAWSVSITFEIEAETAGEAEQFVFAELSRLTNESPDPMVGWYHIGTVDSQEQR